MDYDFSRKRHYRRTVWNALESSEFMESRKDTEVIYLDTAQALETEFLLDRGYPAKNLHVVNNNPAHVAHITRRFPGLNTYGKDVLEVLATDKRTLEVDILNLDLCGQMSLKLVEMLQILRKYILVPGHSLAITLMRGRERLVVQKLVFSKARKWLKKSYVQDWLRETYKGSLELQPMDYERIFTVYLLLTLPLLNVDEKEVAFDDKISWGTYKSDAGKGLSMMWFAGHVVATGTASENYRKIAENDWVTDF